MKTFKRYFWTICATTYAGVFFLRIFHYGFIYEKPAEIILGCVPTVIITFFLIVFFSIFQWPLLNGFDKIIEKGKKDKNSLTKKDIAKLNTINIAPEYFSKITLELVITKIINHYFQT